MMYNNYQFIIGYWQVKLILQAKQTNSSHQAKPFRWPDLRRKYSAFIINLRGLKQSQASDTFVYNFSNHKMNQLGITYKRPHNRGLEQNCLPLALTTAINPAVTPAQSTVFANCCAFRPAIEQTIKSKLLVNIIQVRNWGENDKIFLQTALKKIPPTQFIKVLYPKCI